jgi:DNA-binding NtrC family response regulator
MPSLNGYNGRLKRSVNKHEVALVQQPTCSDTISLQYVGRDHRVLAVLDVVEQVADTDATVLITGETGTGKEIIARFLHKKNSHRSGRPFISVNCGAIAETLQESELFGHAKSAFTGASSRKIGKFEAAAGGTIFLDEINAMSIAMQAKLLRILQSGEYSPVGIAENRYTDVRVVAASGEILSALIEEGKFRRDFYYRLNVIRLELPPLRERKTDIPLLINHFLRSYGEVYNKPGLRLHPTVEDLLMKYDYPGNIRELENIIQRAFILCRTDCISPELLPPEILCQQQRMSEASGKSFPETKALDVEDLGCKNCPMHVSEKSFLETKALVVEKFERRYLISRLKECGGIVSRAAKLCSLSERNFHEKLKKYNIDSMNYRIRALGSTVILMKASEFYDLFISFIETPINTISLLFWSLWFC